jgi:hypothetical protein
VQDIFLDLLSRQVLDAAGDTDALPELPHLIQRQDTIQLGLTNKQDLQQLGVVGFEVRQHPDLFQQVQGKVLRFVDDEHRSAALGVLPDQVRIEVLHQLDLAFARRLQAEVLIDHGDELFRRYFRVEHAGERNVRAHRSDQLPDQRRFPRSYPSGHQNEPKALLHAIAHIRHCLLVRPAHVEIGRIRHDFERFFLKMVVGFVHDLHAFRCSRAA